MLGQAKRLLQYEILVNFNFHREITTYIFKGNFCNYLLSVHLTALNVNYTVANTNLTTNQVPVRAIPFLK